MKVGLIDVDALIERVKEAGKRLIDEGYNGADVADFVAEIVNAIKELPSAEQWIPCSERLPNITNYHTSEPCIVCCDNGAYAFAELEENIFGQVGWNCERDDEYYDPVGVVVAWMPLPEPYLVGR